MKVTVLYLGSIFERNGVAKVVKVFADKADSLKQLSGHEVNVVDSKTPKISQSGNRNKKDSFISRLKKMIVCILGDEIRQRYRNSYLSQKKQVELIFWGGGNRIIEKYKSLGLHFYDKAFIFHETFTCWAYIKTCLKENMPIGKYILVLHSNGEPYKMLLYNYPALKGTSYMKEINKRHEECLKYASIIVFVSEFSAKTFKNLYPDYSDIVRVVPNGISKEINPSEPVFDGNLRIITVGTVCRRKNQITLIECLKDIRKKVDAVLTIVGGGPELDNCKQCAKDLGIEQWIKFLGPRDDIPELLAKSNLFVLPSLDEGLPISAIEAMRAKMPLVLTDVGGCRELIKGNGFLVNPTKEDITNAIIEYGKNVEKQKEMSKASYDYFNQHYTVDSMVEGYANLIKEMLA